MISRETQKSELRNRVKQTVREAYTQMQLIYNNDDDAIPTVVIDNSFDNYRIPGPYEDSNAWEEKRRLAAIVIQKYLRRKIAQLAAHRMRRYAIERRQVSRRMNFLILRSGKGLGFRNCTSWNNLRFIQILDPLDRWIPLIDLSQWVALCSSQVSYMLVGSALQGRDIVMHPEMAKVSYPLHSRSCAVHYRNISGITEGST
jgi:hypothetical protein